MEANEIAMLCLSGSTLTLHKRTDLNETEPCGFRTRKNSLWSGDDHLEEGRAESGCRINFHV